jgi:hypothetical protein
MPRTTDIQFDRGNGRQRQKCKVCGCLDKFNFTIRDTVWRKVVPARYRNKVVCLACFDAFAFKRRIDYSAALKVLYFAGDGAVFKFQTVAEEEF